jgi:hypothetical protein
LGAKEIMKLVKYLVSNTFLRQNNSLYRQKVGIPMGTNCAPVLANLFLYYYESLYVSKIEREQGVRAARKFQWSFRLIDDVLSFDNPLLKRALSKSHEEGGMYPQALKLNPTNPGNPLEADFLGIHIEAIGKRLELSVFDKKKTFPFKMRRYPLMCSLIPRSIPYGVFVGQLHRSYRINTSGIKFLTHATEIAQICLANGCLRRKILSLFGTFASKHAHKYNALNLNTLTRKFNDALQNKS